MSLLRRLFASRASACETPRATAPRRLPDGSEFDPPWTAIDDYRLSQGMMMKQPDFGSYDAHGLQRAEVALAVPGLFTADGELNEAPTEQAVDIVETVAQFMASYGRKRTTDDVVHRLSTLFSVYGASNKDFMRFQMDAEIDMKQEDATPRKAEDKADQVSTSSGSPLARLWKRACSPSASSSTSAHREPSPVASGGRPRLSVGSRGGPSPQATGDTGACATEVEHGEHTGVPLCSGEEGRSSPSGRGSSDVAVQNHGVRRGSTLARESTPGGAGTKRARETLTSRPSKSRLRSCEVDATGLTPTGGSGRGAVMGAGTPIAHNLHSLGQLPSRARRSSGTRPRKSPRLHSPLDDNATEDAVDEDDDPLALLLHYEEPQPEGMEVEGAGCEREREEGYEAGMADGEGDDLEEDEEGEQEAEEDDTQGGEGELKAAMALAAAALARAECVGGTEEEVVRWGRGRVLRHLNTPAPQSQLLDGVHIETRRDLLRLLRRTTDGVENVSALLVGPKGAGKHRVLSSAVRKMREDGPGGPTDFLVVHLDPKLVLDESTALVATAMQLQVAAPNLSKSRSNFCDGLRYLLHLLRRTRPGVEGEARREAQSQPVLFVLHDFERFALRAKQSLLYSLFDLMQSDDAQMAVIGLTARNDAVDLLEKRVRSRFSQHIIFCPSALASVDECQRLLQAALAPPRTDIAPSPAGADAYREAWALQLEAVLAAIPHSPSWRQMASEQRLVPGQLINAVRICLSELNAERPLPSLERIEAGLARLAFPSADSMLRELSIVELLLLVCLRRLVDREHPLPHTLKMVLKEYSQFVEESGGSKSPFNYPHTLLRTAFEHLIALGLVSRVDSKPKQILRDQSCLRLAIHSHIFHDFVKKNRECPLDIQRFGTSWIH
ncbi:hypothetical protein AB1Y20_017662 [Prymnesium parvum]|uniref:Origin recognition complex subunit 4 C-terminal domain-containing protein n=1 Tax=Prymnesium parvum TaxID=97485 RepID=A0AB34JMU0_PRYPA